MTSRFKEPGLGALALGEDTACPRARTRCGETGVAEGGRARYGGQAWSPMVVKLLETSRGGPSRLRASRDPRAAELR
jgi:hypothetical protein